MNLPIIPLVEQKETEFTQPSNYVSPDVHTTFHQNVSCTRLSFKFNRRILPCSKRKVATTIIRQLQQFSPPKFSDQEIIVCFLLESSNCSQVATFPSQPLKDVTIDNILDNLDQFEIERCFPVTSAFLMFTLQISYACYPIVRSRTSFGIDHLLHKNFDESKENNSDVVDEKAEEVAPGF